MAATTTIPIVMSYTPFAVEQGFVASRARPGGNVTGISNSRSWFVNLLYDHRSGQWEGHAILSAVFGSNFCHGTSQVVVGRLILDSRVVDVRMVYTGGSYWIPGSWM